MSLSKQLLQCDLCPYQLKDPKGKKFPLTSNLFSHYLRHHAHVKDADKLTCDQCGRAVLDRRQLCGHIFRKHVGQLDVERLLCEECERWFATKRAIHRHFLACHTAGEKTQQLLQCDLCPYQTKGPNVKTPTDDPQRNLYAHFFRCHAHITDADKLMCDQCGCSVLGRGELWVHIYYKHLGQLDVEMVVCEECEGRFATTRNIHRHFLDCHTAGEKAFRCDDCGYSAQQKRHLFHHNLFHHLIGVQFECEVCQKCYKNQHRLQQHQSAQHQQAQNACDACGKRVTGKNLLASHIASNCFQH